MAEQKQVEFYGGPMDGNFITLPVPLSNTIKFPCLKNVNDFSKKDLDKSAYYEVQYELCDEKYYLKGLNGRMKDHGLR